MKKKLNIIGLILLAIFIISCGTNKKVAEFDYGKVKDNKYVNSYFNFELILPADWVVQTKEQTEELAEVGKELIAGDDENLKAVLNAAEINSANLLVVFQYEMGAAVEYNPSFMLVAENLKNAPGIKTGGDYLFQARKLLIQSQVQYDYIDETFNKEVIDNQEFYVMNLTINYMGINIRKKYYSTIQNGFSISTIISYVTDEHKNDLEKVINSIRFKN